MAIGSETLRQRFVRVGWMNLRLVNIPTVSAITTARITSQCGCSAKSTRMTMFQQAGKPAKLLSLVFMRVSAK